MKIALVHDWFNTKLGGAERVALELAKLFPEAPVYTLMFNKSKFGDLIDPARIRTSFLQRLPVGLKNRPRYLLPLIPRAVASFDFKGYEMVISSSSAWVKNIKHPNHTIHICYCHSPMRFAWDYKDKYMAEQRVDPIQKTGGVILREYVKRWDKRGSLGVDYWIANSVTVAERIKRYYQRTAEVVYPPVDTSSFKPIPKSQKQNFYLTAGMLTPYKKIDLVITAFNISGRRLIVMGEGTEYDRLSKLANDNVQLVGFVDEAAKRRLFAQARGLIFPAEEDFGIAPIEAMASGTPVIAYGAGGLTETVVEGKTGLFFERQTPQAINQTLDRFEGMDFYPPDLTNQAARFDRSVFRHKIKSIVQQVTSDVSSK